MHRFASVHVHEPEYEEITCSNVEQCFFRALVRSYDIECNYGNGVIWYYAPGSD